MTVTYENGHLKVLLTEAETVRYCIDEVLFNEGSVKANAALLTLFKAAVEKSAFKLRSDRLLIEIYPVFTGGCEVLFIPDGNIKKGRVPVIVRNRQRPFCIAEFNSSEQMLTAVTALYSKLSTRYIKSSLYENQGAYRLIIQLSHDIGLLSSVISNHSDRVYTSNLLRAVTAEHWHELCLDTAVETVGFALERKSKD